MASSPFGNVQFNGPKLFHTFSVKFTLLLIMLMTNVIRPAAILWSLALLSKLLFHFGNKITQTGTTRQDNQCLMRVSNPLLFFLSVS